MANATSPHPRARQDNLKAHLANSLACGRVLGRLLADLE